MLGIERDAKNALHNVMFSERGAGQYALRRHRDAGAAIGRGAALWRGFDQSHRIGIRICEHIFLGVIVGLPVHAKHVAIAENEQFSVNRFGRADEIDRFAVA